MTFSIIIPVYNTETYLRECFISISNSIEEDFEVIVIDDGSSDNSGLICDHYVKLDSRFKVFHIKNSGASAARNYGLEKANGKYIVFIDSDDYIKPGRLSAIKTYIENNDFVYASYYNSGVLEDCQSIKQELLGLSAKEFKKALSNNSISLPGFVWCGGYHKDIIQRNGIKFDTNVSIGEDVLFNLSYLEYCHNVMYIDNNDYVHRENLNSLVHKYYPEREAKEENECKSIEKLCNCECLYKRFYYWHVALNHFELWIKKGEPHIQKSARKNLKKCYHNTYFRQSIPFKRIFGTLDEKIETYMMGYYRHKLFQPILKLMKYIKR